MSCSVGNESVLLVLGLITQLVREAWEVFCLLPSL